MENSLEQYISIGVGLIVATATILMIISTMSLRRDAALTLDTDAYFERMSSYKQRFDGLNNFEATPSDVVSIISIYADDIDIYVVGTTTSVSATLKIDKSNRYLLDYVSPTDAEIINAYSSTSAIITPNMRTLAKKYGIASAQALGQLFYGTTKWTVRLVYDGVDVATGGGLIPQNDRSEVTGIRIIRK